MTEVIYPGTFNPWTKGHDDILKRALKLFDKVDIVVAKNPNKNVDSKFISWTLTPLKFIEGVNVVVHDGLVSDFKKPVVRGVRSGDWEYEQNLAQWNRELGVETVFLCPNPSLSHINSTAIRTLVAMGQEETAETYAGNKHVFWRWMQREIPTERIYFGKIASGKSTHIKEVTGGKRNYIDCDEEVWNYLDYDKFWFNVGLKINVGSQQQNVIDLFNLIPRDSCSTEKQIDAIKGMFRLCIDRKDRLLYNVLTKIFGECVDWERLFNPDWSYEASVLGNYFEFIPPKVLAKFRLVKISASEAARNNFIRKRKLSKNTVQFLDSVYTEVPYWDDEVVIVQGE